VVTKLAGKLNKNKIKINIDKENDMVNHQPHTVARGFKTAVDSSRNSHSLAPILLLILLLIACSSLFAGARVNKVDASDLIVKNLTVSDIPNDDGSGLRITWEPLPTSARIISYRIYRGTTPDSLFYIGEIPVNPKMGVSGEMQFLDKDFNSFVDIGSPGRLRREKQQPAGSPIFRAIPRDLSIVGPMLQNYSILGMIPKNEFYFRSKQVDQDDRVFAGLKPTQFTMFKKLIPGNEYWYTVIAVNERRVFLPYATPVSGIPFANEPEPPSTLYTVFVEDLQELKFEWDQPLYNDDLQFFRLYAVSDAEVYNHWFETSYSAWIDIKAEDPQFPHLHAPVPATNIAVIPLPQPFTPTTFHQVNLIDNQVIRLSDGEVLYTFTKPVPEYNFILSYRDYDGVQSYGKLSEVRTVMGFELPTIPPITIEDRPNDKGDYLQLHWGKPTARITAVTYLNEAETKLLMSYDYSENKDNKLKNIFFEISDESGRVLATRKVFFFDGIFRVNLPAGETYKKLNVKMYFRIKGQQADPTYFLTQEIVYDDTIKTLRPQKLYAGGVSIDDFTYRLIKRPKTTQNFRLSRTLPAFDRAAVDLIGYEANIFKGVSRFDLNRGLLLVDAGIDFVYDWPTQSTVQTTIFASEAHKSIENLRNEIAEYQANLNAAETEEDIAHWQMYVDHFTAVLENQEKIAENNHLLSVLNSINRQKARVRFLKRHREIDRREFTYQMLISDNRGLFTLQEIASDPKYMIPISNWFEKTKLPALIASLIFGLLVSIMFQAAKRGKDLYIRPIAGIEEIDNAIGRATEMGRPILFCPGLSGIGDVATLAGLSILSRIAKKAAEYDTKIIVPNRDLIVLPIAQEIVREAHSEAGRPDSFDKNNIFFVSEQQFAYVAGVNGIMIREKTATNFYMGMFYAESLIMTETGNSTGAIQIAGTDAVTQIPFFITTCDYTLMGEELYAASAYMAKQPLMLGTLKAQDHAKAIILIFLILGTVLTTFQVTTIIDAFPSR
jgi:hypothetical protein